MSPRALTHAIAVVGGGVIGLSIALAARRGGAEVLLLERDRIGGGASAAASGIVTLGLHGRTALRRLRRAGYSAMERWLPTLPANDGRPVGERRPAVRLFHGPPETPEKLLAAWRAAGHAPRFVEPEEIAAHLPGLDPATVTTGLLLDREIIVDPPRLLRSLAAACRSEGVRIEEGCGDLRVVKGEGRDVHRVLDAEGEDRAAGTDTVVIAAGWRSAAAIAPLAMPELPLAPVGGIGLDLAVTSEGAGDWTAHFGEKGRFHRVVRDAERVYLGSTVRAEGSTAPMTPDETERLLEAARLHFPELGGFAGLGDAGVHVHDGLRPKTTVIGGPLVGALPAAGGSAPPSLWLATGHYRFGIATAAATADALCAAWGLGDAEEPPDVAFAVERGWS